jgi:hypothetical protein
MDSCEHSNGSSGSTKGGEFPHQLRDCQILKNMFRYIIVNRRVVNDLEGGFLSLLEGNSPEFPSDTEKSHEC